MILHQMTWPEVGTIDFNNTLVLIPVGATEQHGPHLPTDTDTLLVSKLAEETERRLPSRILLTPTTWLGHSPHHLSFGGTLSAEHSVYISMIKSVCLSYIGMGAKRLWIVNGHGGNRAPLSIVLQELKTAHKDVMVFTSEYWSLAKEEISALRESGFGGMGHACELETSLYLYLKEEGVRRSLIQDDGQQPDGELFKQDMLLGGSGVSTVFDFHELTESGVFGEPSLASKEKGQRFFAAISGKLAHTAELLLE
ncbi:MAG: crnA 1 [Paenibacillus sp.]|nr:crnA 1 [Paenibacillus sp.]